MGINIKGVLKGALISVLITLVQIFILALIAYFTRAGENVITIGAYASIIIGSLAGSVLVALSAPNKRFIHVMLSCAVYTLALVGVSFALNGAVMFNAHMAAVIGGIFAAALLGLILGNR